MIYDNRLKLEAKQFDDIYEDLNSVKGTIRSRASTRSLYKQPYSVSPFYTIKDGSYLLIYNFNETDKIIKLRYKKTPTVMTLSTSTCTIDKDIYARTTIPYLAVAEMMFNRGEEARGAEIINFAM